MTGLKNIQIVDGANNATFSVFQATEAEFAAVFPGPGQDMELAEDFFARLGEERSSVLEAIWERPILKRDAQGIHGTLFYGWETRRHHIPATKREIDLNPSYINTAQRALFAKAR